MSLHDFGHVTNEANHQRNVVMAVPLIPVPLILHHPHRHCSYRQRQQQQPDAAAVAADDGGGDGVGMMQTYQLHLSPGLFLVVIQNPVPANPSFAENGNAECQSCCCCYCSAAWVQEELLLLAVEEL